MTSEPSGNTTALHTLQVPADFWHRRIGHVNSQSLRTSPDSSDNGINFSDMSPCDVCGLGKRNNNGNAIDPQKGSSSSGNTADISITDHDEIPPTAGRSATPELPPSGDDGSTPSPNTTVTKAQPKGSEQGGARAQANAAAAPMSGLNAHQHREPRNREVLANPAACDAGVEHNMGILLDYALATSKPRSEHRLDGEVIATPNTCTFKVAMKSSQAAKWKEGSDKGMARLEKHEAVDLAPSGSIPSEKVIRTKWVFKVIAEHALKGRVVVQGWGQAPGVDCGCTYASACRIQSIRMALTIAVHEDCYVLQLDVQTAFLHLSVQEQVFFKTPPDYGSADVATGLPYFMKLKRGLYGLRRNPRNWFNGVSDSLKGMGFTSTTGPCVYTFGTRDTSSILTLYVDNLLLLGGNTPVLKELKRKMMERFTMTDMGYVSLVLDM